MPANPQGILVDGIPSPTDRNVGLAGVLCVLVAKRDDSRLLPGGKGPFHQRNVVWLPPILRRTGLKIHGDDPGLVMPAKVLGLKY